MLSCATAMESKVEVFRAGKKSLKRTRKNIIAQCSVFAKSGSTFPRYVNENVPNQLQALALTFDIKQKGRAAWEAAELQQCPTDSVRKWINRADQKAELEITNPDG